MKLRHQPILAIVAALMLAVLIGGGVTAVEDDGWDKRFNGHDMWLTSFDEALASATELNRPLLLDIYSPT